MDELKEKLIGLGLSEEMAMQVIELMGEFLKSKVPAPYQSLVETFLAGQSPDLSNIGGSMMDKMKGLFGGR
jgi:hypothetical protein